MGYNDCKLTSLVSKGLDKSRGFDHFLARTPSQRDAVFKIRHHAYISQKLIRGSGKSTLSDWQDDEKSSSIYGITLHGDLVSTIRLSVISRNEKACTTYSMFKEYLEPIVDDGEKIVDGSRLAVNCSNSALRRSVILYTFSLTAAFSASVGADRGVMMARHNHVPFYQRYGFEVVSGPFSYHESLTPLSLMMIRLPKERLINARYSVASASDDRIAPRRGKPVFAERGIPAVSMIQRDTPPHARHGRAEAGFRG